MPKCLFRYQWVKLPRTHLPVGKGIMGYWAKLASRAAFRKGRAKYCGYTNDVMPGMWSGGVVGLKSILGVKSRTEALEIMNMLSQFGYIRYTLDAKTKKLEYVVTDWVVKCSGAECMSGAVYATDGYGFLCLPRNITQRLADQHYTFGESDAWLDLWCHTVWQETGNAFSYLAPAVQFGRLGAALTLEALGRRWGWEKTKVWRFFQKNGDAFALHRLPGSYGCLIFNRLYPLDTEASLPTCAEIERIIEKMRICAGNAHIGGSDNARLNKMILWYSRRIIIMRTTDYAEQVSKSTIIKCLINLIQRDSGKVEFWGENFNDKNYSVMNRVGTILSGNEFYDGLTIRETKKIISGAYSNWNETVFQEYWARWKGRDCSEKQRLSTMSRQEKEVVLQKALLLMRQQYALKQ